jgi:hypothetical protein
LTPTRTHPIIHYKSCSPYYFYKSFLHRNYFQVAIQHPLCFCHPYTFNDASILHPFFYGNFLIFFFKVSRGYSFSLSFPTSPQHSPDNFLKELQHTYSNLPRDEVKQLFQVMNQTFTVHNPDQKNVFLVHSARNYTVLGRLTVPPNTFAHSGCCIATSNGELPQRNHSCHDNVKNYTPLSALLSIDLLTPQCGSSSRLSRKVTIDLVGLPPASNEQTCVGYHQDNQGGHLTGWNLDDETRIPVSNNAILYRSNTTHFTTFAALVSLDSDFQTHPSCSVLWFASLSLLAATFLLSLGHCSLCQP